MVEELMVQQQVDNVWQHMVGVICLNLTSRNQVKPILTELFKITPTPEEFLKVWQHDSLSDFIKPLGMFNIRAHRIMRMTHDILKWDGEDATKLFGIGKYGSDSYRIFYKNDIPNDVEDKELLRYINEEIMETVEVHTG
tara:strand:+ start:7501 stop:7917 length:417 start_codon:yes stop_codon:yes gene_type:complete